MGYYLINLAEKSIETTKEIRIGGKQLKDTNLIALGISAGDSRNAPTVGASPKMLSILRITRGG
jgi:hypothetical protein